MKDLSLKQIAERGNQIYEEELKNILEGEENIGKFVAIEVDSGDYFIDETSDGALLKAREKYPSKVFHLIRIGHSGVYDISRALSGEKYGWAY